MKRIISILMTVLSLMTVSCQKEPAELNILTKALTYDVEESEQSISFSCNYPWTAETVEDWLFISKRSGEAGDVVLTVKCFKNKSEKSRSGVITINCEELSSTVSVTQEALVLKKVKEEDSSMELGWKGQDFAIDVLANTQYFCTIKSDWIEEVSTKAPSVKTHIFHIAENKRTDARSSIITFSQGIVSFNVEITQAARPVLEFSPSSIEFKSYVSTVEVKVKSSGTPEVRIPDDAPWLSVTSEGDVYSFTAQENESTDVRTSVVEFNVDGLIKKLEVTQEGASSDPFIDIYSGEQYTINHEGGLLAVDIRSNLELETVSGLPEWIRMESFEHNGKRYALNLMVDEHDPTEYDDIRESFKTRTCMITISDNGGHEAGFTVTQDPVPYSSITYGFRSGVGGIYKIRLDGDYSGYIGRSGGFSLLDKSEYEYVFGEGDYYTINLTVRGAEGITIPAVNGGQLDLRML